ncbi:MAG TPA: hypothetical protein VGC18_13245 [Lacisediminihabitans sp.]|uniref:hypothetical protein n=1 Tax=Lacisediminihabitans sp. TaxID=2787631 RepID=UPI002ED82ADC
MSWPETTSWLLTIVGITALLVALAGPAGSGRGRVSRRRVFLTAGAVLLVAAGLVVIGATLSSSSRSTPV